MWVLRMRNNKNFLNLIHYMILIQISITKKKKIQKSSLLKNVELLSNV